MSESTHTEVLGSEQPTTATQAPLHLWREAVYIAVFYGLYTLVRNNQGSAREARGQAFTNAKRVIRSERLLGMFHEESIQEFFLPARHFIQFLNTWYGVAHFVVTLAALVWCFRCMPLRYRSVRNGLAFMTGLALVGFAFFPLLPPRLLPGSYGFVDTLKVFGGPWSFDSGPMAKVSNQYAAMPSLHFGWASWCTVVFWPWATSHWRKLLLLAYPLLTLSAIVVTANHYLLDAAGGLVTFVVGTRLGVVLARTGVLDIFRRRAH